MCLTMERPKETFPRRIVCLDCAVCTLYTAITEVLTLCCSSRMLAMA